MHATRPDIERAHKALLRIRRAELERATLAKVVRHPSECGFDPTHCLPQLVRGFRISLENGAIPPRRGTAEHSTKVVMLHNRALEVNLKAHRLLCWVALGSLMGAGSNVHARRLGEVADTPSVAGEGQIPRF